MGETATRRKRVSRRIWWLLALIAVGALLLLAEARRRSGLYWYDVAEGYAYAFPDARTVPVEISERGITVPELPIGDAWLALKQGGEGVYPAKRAQAQKTRWLYAEVLPSAQPRKGKRDARS